MTLDEIIEALMAVERDVTNAIEEEEYEEADRLTEKRNDLIKELCALEVGEDEKEKYSEFVRAMADYCKEQIANIEDRRKATRDEIIKLRKGSSGLSQYTQVRRHQ